VQKHFDFLFLSPSVLAKENNGSDRNNANLKRHILNLNKKNMIAIYKRKREKGREKGRERKKIQLKVERNY